MSPACKMKIQSIIANFRRAVGETKLRDYQVLMTDAADLLEAEIMEDPVHRLPSRAAAPAASPLRLVHRHRQGVPPLARILK
jgi:hypothetical protein